ncbi:MAG: undecaprenyl/decaprenyl-phosphate alpha-N-acetylglucosaminyl 1-phosphate transferase [Chitinispirillales bacterium]|jgi:UDP-GlcNAc:undecaprenyl-phosphate GlcNAc-1-phosphate transferase|nr:undecaprenyl/decaprenyl-phosphate alpha-N-acetylglucosaminyl 1-phosphate transferase [Chitinispirillales bacterium]
MSEMQYIIISLLALFSAVIAACAIQVILHTKLVSLFVDPPDIRKVHSAPIPRIGGIAIILAVLVTVLFWYALSEVFGIIPLPDEFLLSILAAVVALGIFGFMDDSRFFSMRVRDKLIAVIALAVATVFLFDIHPGAISVFGFFEIPELVSKVIAVLWIIGLINAYNLVDGLDGFAGTISIVSLSGVAAASLFAGDFAAAVLSVIVAGAIAGFMVHNAPPAKVFMGDTGSLFLGFIISMLTIHIAGWGWDGISGKVPLVMPLIAGIPILEVFVTIVRRYFKASERGHPFKRIVKYIVSPDSSHIHHRFLFRGFSHLETCILVGTLAATLIGGAVCILLVPLFYSPLIALYLIIPVSFSLYKLGFGGRFKKALKVSKSRYNGYHKPELIGVIESDGRLFNYLSSKRSKGYSFVPLVNEKDLPLIANQLKATIIRNSSDLPELAVRVAKELSTMYGFSPLSYTGSQNPFNIILNKKAPLENIDVVHKALQGFTDEIANNNAERKNKTGEAEHALSAL